MLNAEEWLLVAAEARTCLESAVACELRAHNEERVSQLRLPQELWVEVWGHLPMGDVVSISHVCHLWRSLALASPSLWSTLEVFSDMHVNDCDCEECGSIAKHCIVCKRCRRTPTLGTKNTKLIRHLLPRSKSCALSLIIRLSDYETKELARLITPHRRRLVRIECNDYDSRIMAAFLSHFEALRAVRELSTDGSAPPVSFMKKIKLPSLQQLKVRGTPFNDRYDYASGRLVFPSVTRLVLPYGKHETLILTLEVVPNLEALDLDGSNDSKPINLDYPRLSQLTADLDGVQLRRLAINTYSLAIALYTPQRRSFAVELVWGAEPRSVPFYSIFADLCDDVQLSICSGLFDDPKAASRYFRRPSVPIRVWNLHGTDSHGRHRRITHHPKDGLETLWEHLSPSSLSALCIDVVLVPIAFKASTGCWALHELTINHSNADSLSFANDGDVPWMPELRVLRVKAPASSDDAAPAIPGARRPSRTVYTQSAYRKRHSVEAGVS
ncbi:hypothetical protein EXIGLDRAFT_834468 [Exidia glandulosa HHB12029]|uniref:F-box domain-containing protein n=1 Tax=Exidia glandulosa HHB12029 TaxID=1314781 RepID=A0A165JQX9_EXIGL|nr:hypothetical protein EXIGLDRAFT_834468 [Exidia glandulosa HHB12029]